MSKPTQAEAIAALTEQVAALTALVAAEPKRARSKSKARTFATKAEREAGKGFPCSCGRNDLRVAPHEGSFHKAPDGTIHTI